VQKGKLVTMILRLAMIVALLSSFLAFTVPALAQTSVAEKRSPAPDNYILGGGIEAFWARVTFLNEPAELIHRVSVATPGPIPGFDPAHVVHTHKWTFPGSPTPVGGEYELIPDNVSPIYNPEIYDLTTSPYDAGEEALHESRYNTADPDRSHNATIPGTAAPGTYVSRFDYYRIDTGTQLPVFDSAAEVTFLVAQGLTVFKYNDIDGNGVFDNGDVGLPGWQFTITGPPSSIVSGNTTVTTVSGNTDVNGFFGVLIVATGNYTITETGQAGWVNTDPGPNPPGTYPAIKIVNVTEPDTVVMFGNFQLTPGTAVGISAAANPSPLPNTGGLVTLTVSEENTGQLDLTGAHVDVTSNLVAPWDAFTVSPGVQPAGTVFAGDDGDGVLEPPETWTWTISSVPIPANPGPGVASYTFVAIGHGFIGDLDVTFDEFPGERDSTSVSVPPPITVPGLSSLSLGLLIAALGGLMGLFLYRRARQAKLRS